jgi:hypothetical protein
LVTIALAVLSAGALWVDRSIQFFIGRDSSLFLYVAQRVRDGAVPYRDVWDHKPPLIYYLDVIGLSLADRGLPGVAVVEFAALFIAAALGFGALRRAMGPLPALFGSVAWMTAIPLILGGGNRPEEFAWPLQFGSVTLFIWERGSRASRWRWLAIGVTAGFAALLKPTVLGLWVAIYLAEAARAWDRRSVRAIARPLLFGALGGLAIALGVLVYFFAKGAGDDLIDQVVRYNVPYSRSTVSERLEVAIEGMKLLSYSGLFPIAVAAWVAALLQLARRSVPAEARPLFVVGVFALPIDFALAGATGRPYAEYFLGCLPTLGIMAAIAASTSRPMLERAAARLALPAAPVGVGALGVAAVLLASAIPAFAQYRREIGPNLQDHTRPLATTYVVEHTQSGDRVLFWGGEGGLNYTTGRRAPTRYAYQYALYMRDYQRPAQVAELLAALQRDPPALIVDASPATTDVPPLDRAARAGWTLVEPKSAVLPEMDGLFRWIEERYVRVGEMGPLRWPIYEPRAGAG